MGNNEVQARKASPVTAELMRSTTALKSVIGEDPKKFMRMALNVLEGNHALSEAANRNPGSFIGAVMAAARDGFEPGDGNCYLIPYKGEVSYQRSYVGVLEMARRTGKYKSITHGVIKQGDLQDGRFEAEKGYDAYLIHRPDWFSDRGPVVGYYCCIEMLSGERDFAIMSVKEIEDHRRKFSKAPNSDAWVKSFDAMAIKTVILQALKGKPKTANKAPEGVIRGYQLGPDGQVMISADEIPQEEPRQSAQTLIDQLPAEGQQPEPANEPPKAEPKKSKQEPAPKPAPEQSALENPYFEELRQLEVGLMHQIKGHPNATSKDLPRRFKAAMDADDRMFALLRLKAEMIAEDLPDADMAIAVVAEAKDAKSLLEIIDQFSQALPPDRG